MMSLQADTYRLHLGAGHPSSIHSDLLALACVLAFHPALPEGSFDLHFPFPVSDSLKEALGLPYILPQARITSEGEEGRYVADRYAVLSYGGGFDSLAAHALLPELTLVHQAPADHEGIAYKDVVNDLMVAMGARHVVARDNMRNLFDVWGLPLWVSVYLPSLLLAPKYIVSGSEMTGTYLEGGKRFLPRHRNRWYQVFEAAGVAILPTSFLSEVANARITYLTGTHQHAAYCAFIKNQDCGQCTKCLRRRMLRAALDPQDIALVDEFKRSESVDAFLKKRPLYYGDVFAYAARKMARPTWVHEHIRDVTDRVGELSFHDYYFPQALDDFRFPADIRGRIEGELAKLGVPPMPADVISTMQAYAQ